MNFLVNYFGERRDEPCGHCTNCTTGHAVVLRKKRLLPDVPSGLDVSAFRKLREEHPDELKYPRACARFLAGLTSPKLVKAKLTRQELFGALGDRRRFAEILAWCEGLSR